MALGSPESQVTDKAASRISPATWLLLAILLLAAALRLYRLGDWPVYQDELYTLHDARAFGDDVNYLRPFYYFLQYLLLEIAPPTPLYLRLPPFVFGVLGVWLTYDVGRRVFGAPAGLVSAFLVSISAWHLYASQFARYWTLVYLLAAFVYLVLPRAVDTDQARAYLVALVALVVGALTHPTFVFPMVGGVFAVILVSESGRVGFKRPSRPALLYLWGPLVAIALGGLIFQYLTGSIGGLLASRGLTATLRLFPAMVQWTSPPVVAVAAVGAAFFLLKGQVGDRRWGAITCFAWLAGAVLLLGLSFRTSVYADYGMAMLPLVYVTVGGFAQRIAERMASGGRQFLGVVALALAAAVLPGTVSHLSDGTRFDYRPAYSYIKRAGSDRLVLGWPGTIQRYYAADLVFETVRTDPRFLTGTLEQTSGFWLVASYRRYGMVGDDGRAARWVDANCRRVLTTE
jgi:hypothetical protein